MEDREKKDERESKEKKRGHELLVLQRERGVCLEAKDRVREYFRRIRGLILLDLAGRVHWLFFVIIFKMTRLSLCCIKR